MFLDEEKKCISCQEFINKNEINFAIENGYYFKTFLDKFCSKVNMNVINFNNQNFIISDQPNALEYQDYYNTKIYD